MSFNSHFLLCFHIIKITISEVNIYKTLNAVLIKDVVNRDNVTKVNFIFDLT